LQANLPYQSSQNTAAAALLAGWPAGIMMVAVCCLDVSHFNQDGTMKKLLLASTLLLLLAMLLIALGQIDDELSPKAQDLLVQAKPAASSEAFLFLHGILAAPDDDPVQVGTAMLQEYRKQEADASYQLAHYEAPGKLTLPQGELHCYSRKDGCLQTLFTTDADYERLLAEHALLRTRAERFFQYDEFATLTRPALTEMIVSLHPLIAAVHLEALAAISLHRAGQSAAAMAALRQQMAALRHAMRLQDTLIGRMTLLAGLNHLLDVTGIIVLQADMPAAQLPALTAAEIDMSTVVAREFALFHNEMQKLDQSHDLLQADGKLPGLLARLLFKPNMTSNAHLPEYLEAINSSTLPPGQFVRALAADDKASDSGSWLRNFSGTRLLQVQGNMSRSYLAYTARLLDFQAKLLLFNHHLHAQQALATADNPYYPGQGPVVTGTSACFRGPVASHYEFRCLQLGW